MFIYERQPMKEIAIIFKALSDDTRLRVIKLLQERELCVCELMQVLDMSQPRISRHMSVLKNAGLVEDRREGKWVHYFLCNGTDNEDIKRILQSFSQMANDNQLVQEDKKKLKKALRLSEKKICCAPGSKK
jgi:ArsR family transcriptional regulator